MARTAQRAPTRRRQAPVTRAFLFCDLRGYTDFVERKGDAAAARLLKDYRTLVRREVARKAGAEIKTEGDSFYVVFDSASAALDCSVGILRRAAARNEREPGAPLGIGVGLHAGETVAFDEQFVGSAVNIASRLASQAGPGELIVSDTLRGLVRTGTPHAMTDRGSLGLKGVAEPVRAWAVTWQEAGAERAVGLPPLPSAAPVAEAAPGQLVCPVVVGRDAERARAAELIAAAKAGHGQTLLVGGEAGVGKSAFVREVVALAGEAGFRLLYGVTLESDRGLPYAPFLAAVRSGFRGLERERLGRVLAQAAPDLAALFPELGRPAHAAEPGGADQHRLSLAFQGLFATFARESPVVLVGEDLHWADEASLALLHYLARELRDSRVFLLATYRSDELHRRHPFLRALAGLQRERLTSEVALKRLEPEQVRELIRATFARSDPSITVSEAFSEAIYARSEGNPFFTEELLKSLVESGDVYYDAKTGWERKPIEELRIPGSIKEAVRQRVETLSAEARTTLAVASVAGLQFTFDVLRAARAIDEVTLEAHLWEFIEQQLVVELAGDEERYAFRHALTREVIYDDLLVRERKRLHRAVADALAAVTTTEPSLLAHHLLAAGEAQRALPHLREAAARSRAAGAPREAAAHYERAIEIGLPEDQLPATIEGLAEVCQSFDEVRSLKAAEEALALYRGRADRRGASRMLRLASRVRWSLGDAVRARAMAHEAIAELAGEESAELGRALAHLAGLDLSAGEYTAAVPIADQAIALGERFVDAWTLANATVTKGSSMYRDDPEEGLAVLLRGRDLAIRHGLVEAALRGYNNAAIAMFAALRPAEERLRLVEEGLAYSRRQGVERLMTHWLVSERCWIQFGLGEWDAAEASAALIGAGSAVYPAALVWRARMALGRAGPAAALPLLEEAAEIASRGSEGSYALVRLLAAASTYAFVGDIGGARRWAGQIRSLLERDPRGRLTFGTFGLMPTAILAASLAEPDWLDLAAAEMPRRQGPMLEAQRSALEAAGRLLAADAPGCAKAVARVLDFWVGFGDAGFAYDFALALMLIARRRGLALGPEWDRVRAEVGAFATKVGARWWLAQLDEVARA